MRILLSCLQSLRQHGVPPYDFWRQYFVEGCREANIECVEVPGVDWAEGLTYPAGAELIAWRARTWERVLEFVRKARAHQPLDLFLGYLFPTQVDPAAISELQRLGLPCVNFFCDNVRQFREVPEVYRPFSLHWVPEFEALPMYRRAGLPHEHAPMPCWVPPSFRNVPEIETEPPTFIGSADILRRDLLGRALEAGAELVIRGPGWEPSPKPERGKGQGLGGRLRNQIETVQTQGWRTLAHKVSNRLRPLRPPDIPASVLGPFLSKDEHTRVTREAVVTIGINRVPKIGVSLRRPQTYSRLRDIEAPMLGACYLTEWTEGLGELYELGIEIETYRTPEELVVKLDRLQKDPVYRRTLRGRAQRRALADHSVARSLGQIAARLVGN